MQTNHQGRSGILRQTNPFKQRLPEHNAEVIQGSVEHGRYQQLNSLSFYLCKERTFYFMKINFDRMSILWLGRTWKNLEGLFGSNIMTSSQLACQLSWQSAAPVSHGSWVQIPYGPEFFSGLISTTSSVVFKLRGSLLCSPNYPVIFSHRCSTTVSLETYHLHTHFAS